MKVDLTICKVIPEDYAILILIAEYLGIFITLCIKLCTLLAKKQDIKEIYIYLVLSLLCCLLRLLELVYSILFIDLNSFFLALTIFAQLPSLSGASVLSATWVKMYLQMGSYSESRLKTLDTYRVIIYISWNALQYIICSLFICFIVQNYINCKG